VADGAGVSQIVLSEHVALAAVLTEHPPVRPGEPPITAFFPSDEEYPEPLVSLAAIAAVTTTARLSTNILIAPLRPAVLLAKMAATVDVLSGGRLDLGVGIGWHRPEFAAAGVPFGHLTDRVRETIGACRALWAGGPSTYSGSTVSFRDLYCSPTPVQGQIPVYFGGRATHKTAGLVAALGDGWSPIGGTTPEEIALGRTLIGNAAAEVDRDVGHLMVRCSLPLRRGADGRPSLHDTLAETAGYVDAGVDIVQLPPLNNFVAQSAPDPVGAAAEVIEEAVWAVAAVVG
jgi:probable F420-dependent oxidoreductase